MVQNLKMGLCIFFGSLILSIVLPQHAELAEKNNWIKIWEVYGKRGSVTSAYIDDNSVQFFNNNNNAHAVTQVITNWGDSTTSIEITSHEFRLPNQSAIFVSCTNATNAKSPDDCMDFRKWGPTKFFTVAIGSYEDSAMNYIWSKIGYKRQRPPGTG